MVLLGFVVDQVAIESELADDGVHLAECEWGPAFEPAADEAVRVGGQADFEGGSTGIVGECGAVLAGQSEQSLDAADGDDPLLAIHLFGQR